MRETELKFQVPAARLASVRKAVATGKAETVRLQARYFDTPDRRLAAAGLALRLRKEGRGWVQTLKWAGDGLMHRGEHEVAIAGARAPPLDPGRHAGTEAGAALDRALGDAASTLAETFATDIRRTRRKIRGTAGALVEVALDEGRIHAGEASVAVCELELELLDGPPWALPELAARWVQRHGLWLDPRSKAERGDRLALGVMVPPAVTARQPALERTMRATEAVRAMLASALVQVLANACEVAGAGSTPEHLHQCRVGLRRLRSVLRDFGPLAGGLPAQAVADLQSRLRALLGRLGSARDRDALRESLLPQVAAAGAPWVELPAAPGDEEEPAAVLRAAAANVLWLDLLALLHRMPLEPDAAPADGPLRRRLGAVLGRLHRRIAADAARFAALDEAAQHSTRKRLKRLRYGAELCSSLFPPKAVARYVAALRRAQDALGDANDLVVARALFEQQLGTEPRAWFVLGWLAARREVVVQRCAQDLSVVGETPAFWRGARRESGRS